MSSDDSCACLSRELIAMIEGGGRIAFICRTAMRGRHGLQPDRIDQQDDRKDDTEYVDHQRSERQTGMPSWAGVDLQNG